MTFSPGPSNLYIIACTLHQGPRAGVAAAMGLALGSIIYVVLSVSGIAALVVFSPVMFTVLKILGAGYLIWLGTQALRTAKDDAKGHEPAKPTSTGLRQSIIVELTNPKSALFFIAFLPQFVTPAGGEVVTQLLILGAIYTLLALGSDLFMVILSGQLRRWLSHHSSFHYWQNQVAGGVLIALGGFILMADVLSLGS
ncbi:LysE family translocator [Salinimonas marina]|uniref:LysE family translocator n=1 Tax=Salinimonas marina TaxID=2785918 RepID=A0A7S9E029_9ALTE|nr:LysE family translocator [Salinimonas marina]